MGSPDSISRKVVPRFRSLLFTVAGPTANPTTAKPPMAMAMGVPIRFANTPACNAPSGLML